jgi:hypothetical protein
VGRRYYHLRPFIWVGLIYFSVYPGNPFSAWMGGRRWGMGVKWPILSTGRYGLPS